MLHNGTHIPVSQIKMVLAMWRKHDSYSISTSIAGFTFVQKLGKPDNASLSNITDDMQPI